MEVRCTMDIFDELSPASPTHNPGPQIDVAGLSEVFKNFAMNLLTINIRPINQNNYEVTGMMLKGDALEAVKFLSDKYHKAHVPVYPPVNGEYKFVFISSDREIILNIVPNSMQFAMTITRSKWFELTGAVRNPLQIGG